MKFGKQNPLDSDKTLSRSNYLWKLSGDKLLFERKYRLGRQLTRSAGSAQVLIVRDSALKPRPQGRFRQALSKHTCEMARGTRPGSPAAGGSWLG